MGFAKEDPEEGEREVAPLLGTTKNKKRAASTDCFHVKTVTDPSEPRPLLILEFPIYGVRPDPANRISKEKLQYYLYRSVRVPKLLDSYKEWIKKRQIDVDVVRVKMESLGLKTMEEVTEEGTSLVLTIFFTESQLEEEAEMLGVEMLQKRRRNDFVVARYERFTRMRRGTFVEQNDSSVFTRADRVRIAMQLVNNELGIGAEHELADWNISQLAPLHDPEEQNGIIRDFMGCCQSRHKTIERMREYYGERVAMYFCWLSEYNHALAFSAVVGIPFFFVNIGLRVLRFRHDWYLWVDSFVVIYSSLLIMWSSWYIVKWNRLRYVLSYFWNTEHVEEESKVRYSFHGQVKFNRVTGKDEVWYPEWKRYIWRYPLSYTIVTLMLILLFGVFVSMLSFKAARPLAWLTGPVAGILNGTSIFVLNAVYKVVAIKMNNLENHKTERDWEDGYIQKTFMFQFLNSYSSLYYIAFFKGKLRVLGIPPYLDAPCQFDDCVIEIAVQLFFQFGTMIVIGQTLEVGIPLLKWAATLIAAKMNTKTKVGHMDTMYNHLDEATVLVSRDGEPLNIVADEVQVELRSAPYDVYDDYSEMVIQFGYVTLFASLMPLAPLLGLINNVIEIRSDAAKMRFNQRPLPVRARDIGKWAGCMKFLSYVALFTNVALIVIYGKSHHRIAALITGADSVRQHDKNWSWWVSIASFFIIEHTFLCIKIIMENLLLPKKDPKIRKQRARLQHERNEAVEKAAAFRRRNYRNQTRTRSGTDLTESPSMSPSFWGSPDAPTGVPRWPTYASGIQGDQTWDME